MERQVESQQSRGQHDSLLDCLEAACRRGCSIVLKLAPSEEQHMGDSPWCLIDWSYFGCRNQMIHGTERNPHQHPIIDRMDPEGTLSCKQKHDRILRYHSVNCFLRILYCKKMLCYEKYKLIGFLSETTSLVHHNLSLRILMGCKWAE